MATKIQHVTIHIKGESPYSASRFHGIEKNADEGNEEHDKRCARHKLHTNGDGLVIIPGIQLKLSLHAIAKYLGKKVPERARATYTKHFEAGTMPLTDINLGVKPEDFDIIALRCDSKGSKKKTSEVTRYFPVIQKWGGDIDFMIMDPIIKPDVFEEHVEQAGLFNGLGRWRPGNGGMNGRFSATFDWK
jgi:hypothetical protein